MTEYQLAPAQLRAIFDRNIRPRYDRLFDRAIRPTIVMTGGQPGSGKTDLGANARHESPRLIEVVGDDLRKFHPEHDQLMESNPLQMPAATQQAAGAWVKMSLEYLREARADVLMETTMRNPEAVVETLRSFREDGYGIEVRVIAVPETISRMGTLQRYEDQVRSQGAGRWAPSHVHDEAYAQMPDTVRRVISEGLVDRIIVQKRDDVTLYDATIVQGEQHKVANAVPGAIELGRRVDQLTPGQATGWLRSLERAADFYADAKVTDPDIRRTVAMLARDVPNVAAAAQPFDRDSRSSEIARLTAALERALGEREAGHHARSSFPRSAPEALRAEQTGTNNDVSPTKPGRQQSDRGSEVGR